MLTRILSATVLGTHAILAEVEADIRPGMATGSAGSPVLRETRVRVETALRNCGEALPAWRLNVAPSDVPMSGAHHDLAAAVAAHRAHRGLERLPKASDCLFVAELDLAGGLRPVRGVLPMAIAARDNGLKTIVVAPGNAREAAVVSGLEVLPFNHLRDVLAWLRGEFDPERATVDVAGLFAEGPTPDFAEIRGQAAAIRALEVAAAGGHHALLVGPAGTGKTMLAKRLPGILPPLSFAEALETTKVYSVAGLLAEGEALVTRRPFRAPHHTISDVGLLGGGTAPRPGEVSLAHNGVLFMDELPEFRKHVLEVLRQPLEDRRVTITRALTTLTYPAGLTLVGAMAPCPCGQVETCRCSPGAIARYRGRVAGPVLEAMDLRVEVPLPARDGPSGEPSASIRERVVRAREIQARRFARHARVGTNAQMGPRLLQTFCEPTSEGQQLLGDAVAQRCLSARGHDRILRVARTIADLAGEASVQAPHVVEALAYQGGAGGSRAPSQEVDGAAARG